MTVLALGALVHTELSEVVHYYPTLEITNDTLALPVEPDSRERVPLDHAPDFVTVAIEAMPMGIYGSTGTMNSPLGQTHFYLDPPSSTIGDVWTLTLERF